MLLKAKQVSISVDFQSSDLVAWVIFKFEAVKQSLQFNLIEMDSSLQQRIFDVSHVDMVLFIKLEDVVHENLLCSTHSCHDIC